MLKQVQGLRFVAVAIGPNDLGWSDLVTYCYAVENCADNLSRGEFDYRLAAFDRDYGTLLAELGRVARTAAGGRRDLLRRAAGRVDPACPDLRGPAAAAGLTAAEVELLAARNDELNTILVAGARKYGFRRGPPAPAPLCAPRGRTEAAEGSGAGGRKRVGGASARTCRAWPTRSRSTPRAPARCARRRPSPG